MNTIFYLIRHSIRLKKNDIESINSSQSDLINSEKIVLSIEGEKRAEILSNISELQNVDRIYSSNCVRTIQTAKYLMNKLDLKLNIDERFDERRVGIENADTVTDWLQRQYADLDYSTINGESQRTVRKRFEDVLLDIIDKYKGKEIAIFSHGYAITFFLLKYFNFKAVSDDHFIQMTDDKGNLVINKKINSPDVFILVLDEALNLVNFENIDVDYGDIQYNYDESQ